jgi:C4-dicarboxylate-specific signal transduction histidine kinase
MSDDIKGEIELEYIPLPAFITNQNFELVDANNCFWDFFGLNLIELGMSLKDYLEDMKELSSAASADDNLGRDIVFNVNGEKKIIQAKGKKALKEFYIFVGVDVTLVNLFEQNNEQQRAAQLETHRLMELNRMVTEIMKEIQKPLVVVNKQVLLVQQKVKGNKELAPVFDKVLKGIQKIVKSINTKLETTTFDQNEEPKPVPLKKIVMDTLKGRVEILRQKGIQVMTDFPEDLVLNVRIGQIKQLLWYLIDNSVDALENLDKKVIMIMAKPEGKRNIAIFVRDSGHGVLPQFHEQIFAPFYTTKPHGQHTGTGLAQAKEICYLHRGNIVYDDSVKNTSFKITLPIG